MHHFKAVIKVIPFVMGSLLLSYVARPQAKALESNGSVHPIVDVARGYFLGGSAHGQWVPLTEAARAVGNQEKYRIYGLKGLVGMAVGDKPKSEGPPCEATLFSQLKPLSKTVAQDEHLIGVAGDWNAQPRGLQLLNSHNAIYRRVVADVLRQHGLRSPIKITQLIRVDLNGDGQPEVLITAKRYTSPGTPPGGISPQARAGDYAFILLRRLVQGRLQTQLLASEFHKTMSTAPNFFRILNVLDLNGDGKMEVVVRGQYYEGDWTTVYSEANGKFKETLSAGCGA